MIARKVATEPKPEFELHDFSKCITHRRFSLLDFDLDRNENCSVFLQKITFGGNKAIAIALQTERFKMCNVLL